MERARLLAQRLGRLIHAARHEMGVTQAQMAARCGLSSGHYGRLERGDTEVTLSALELLAQGFERDLRDLITQIRSPHNGTARPHARFTAVATGLYRHAAHERLRPADNVLPRDQPPSVARPVTKAASTRRRMERADSVVQSFGRAVRALRGERGLLLKEVAQRAGMSAKYAGDVEHGKCAASLRAINGLARAFGVSLSELFARIEGSPDGGQPPPTLDLRTWQRIRDDMQLINDHARRMIAHAESQGARQRSRE